MFPMKELFVIPHRIYWHTLWMVSWFVLAPLLTYPGSHQRSLPDAEPSVCPSVCPSVRQSFFKSNGLPQFSSDLSDIWLECLNVHNNIVQTVMEVEFWFFCFYFANGSLITKIGKKKSKFCGFLAISSKSLWYEPWNLICRYIVGNFRCVWKNAPVGQIFGPFLAIIGQYIGFRLFSWKDSTGFTRNLIYELAGATFVGF